MNLLIFNFQFQFQIIEDKLLHLYLESTNLLMHLKLTNLFINGKRKISIIEKNNAFNFFHIIVHL